jgi:flavin-dependent dehydrogenase
MDVIVAGAGPAGASIARLLAMSGKRVVLVDPGVRATDRLEVLPPAGYEALGAVGLAEVLGDPCIARPCLGIRRRWGSRVPDTDDFLARRGGRGFTIDRAGFDQALCTAAARVGVAFIGGRIVGVRREGGTLWARIATASAMLTAFATVAVDATGRRSAVARRMGAHRQVHERLIAERRSVEPSLDAGETPVWLNVEGADESWSYQMLGPRGRREIWDVYAPGARRRGPANPRVDASSVCVARRRA